uniref:Short-chain dehydrogenase/reductase 3 n=1 Tax=Plectus sambesii TaxID=2011161 RepID=A0A914W999_9BILA
MCFCRWSTLCVPFRFISQCVVVVCLLIHYTIKWIVPDCCRRRKRLTDRIILITGSGNGLGRSLALRLARLKPILVLWDVDESANLETSRLIAESHAGVVVHTYTIDIGDRTAVESAANDVLGIVGSVDILVNNAGTAHGKYLTELLPGDIEHSFQTNLLSHFWTCQAFLPDMITANAGHIVAIASVAGIVGTSHLTDYSATKFGIIGFMESLDIELHNRNVSGINLTTVCPYYLNTALFKGIKTNYHCLLPILDADYVAERVINAIQLNKDFIYLPRMLYFLLGLKGVLPFPIIRYMGFMFGAHTAMLSLDSAERQVPLRRE